MKLIAGLAALGLAALLAGAIGNATRGGGNDVSTGAAEIVIEDLHFTPNQVNARVGQALLIRLVNVGTERHDLNFPSLHMPGLEGVESIVEPGATRTITLRFDEPGSHTFSCSLPGHAAAGMTGAVVVRQ